MSVRIIARTLCILVILTFIALNASVSAAPPEQEVEEQVTEESISPQTVNAFGPARVMDIYPGATPSGIPYSYEFTAIGNTVYFAANDGVNGTELWKSDGTVRGTQLVKDINPGAGSSSPSDLTVVGTALYFVAYHPAVGRELWKSDGTTVGTQLVTNIDSANTDSKLSWLTGVGTTLYFRMGELTPADSLWKSNGTAAGTVRVKDTNPNGADDVQRLTKCGTLLYFIARDETSTWGLWKSNGTESGTVRLKNFQAWPLELKAVGSILYFRGYDGAQGVAGGHGGELWKSNGTPAGTVLVKDINPNGDSFPSSIAAVGTVVYFTATDGTSQGLYKTNGTASGTVLLKQFNGNPFHLTAMGGKLYFFGTDASGYGLWKSSGTAATTVQIRSFPETVTGEPVVLGGALYFSTTDNISGHELWRSDGSVAGTYALGDVVRGNNADGPRELTKVGTRLWFSVSESTGDMEPWVYVP